MCSPKDLWKSFVYNSVHSSGIEEEEVWGVRAVVKTKAQRVIGESLRLDTVNACNLCESIR